MPADDTHAHARPAPPAGGWRGAGLRGAAAPGFAGATLGVLATAVYTQANLLFWLFGLAVGAAVFALLHGSLALRGLAVTRLPAGRAAAGGPLSLGYELRNAGPLAAYGLRLREVGVPVADRLPWAWAPRVAAGGTLRVSAQGPAPARGEHPLAAVEASTGFPLGLFRRRRVFAQADVLRVLPARVAVEPAAVLRSARPRPGPGGASPRVAPGAEGDFYGTRGYRPGDPLRTLDWKRSARQGELMVRELATPEPPRVAVALDLRAGGGGPGGPGVPGGEAAQERAVSLAASLIARAHAAGFRVGLCVFGVACPSFTPHHAPAHRDRLLGALGRLDLAERTDAVEPPGRALREATVFVVPVAASAGGGDPAAELRFAAPAAGRSSRRPAPAPGSALGEEGGRG